jgi:hypothetical protein
MVDDRRPPESGGLSSSHDWPCADICEELHNGLGSIGQARNHYYWYRPTQDVRAMSSVSCCRLLPMTVAGV